jgi:hypothetical protein
MPNTIKLRCTRKCSLKWTSHYKLYLFHWTSNALTPPAVLEEMKKIIWNEITNRIQGSSTNDMCPWQSAFFRLDE